MAIQVDRNYLMPLMFDGDISDQWIHARKLSLGPFVALGPRSAVELESLEDLFAIEELQCTGMINEVQ